jgi:hypothetical protein
MRAMVKRAFVDKSNMALCKPEEIIEVTKKRFDEINKAGFGTMLKEIKESKK